MTTSNSQAEPRTNPDAEPSDAFVDGYSAGRYGTAPRRFNMTGPWDEMEVERLDYLLGLHAGTVAAYEQIEPAPDPYRFTPEPEAVTVHRGPHYLGTWPSRGEAERVARDDRDGVSRRFALDVAAAAAARHIDIREELPVHL